jgi:hypothetical protein
MCKVYMTQYSNIGITPIYGPLSTNKAPCALPYHSAGALAGIRPSPPSYYPGNSTGEYASARNEYKRVPLKFNNSLAQPTKYIAPAASSLFTSARKRAALGKSSLKVGIPSGNMLSFKNYNKNDVNTALRTARSGGYVAPKKSRHYLWKA